MKPMRKLNALLLAAVVMLASVLPGCAAKRGVSSRIRTIPKDGIVRKAELAAVKQSGDVAIYRGKSDGIAYEWTFAGPDIGTPADVNLNVRFHPADESALRGQAAAETFVYVTAQKSALPGNPTLSITMGNGWEDGSYPLYTWSGSGSAAAGDALVVGGAASISPVPTGECYLLRRPLSASASSAQPQSAAAPPAASSSASAAPSSPSAASSASSQKSKSSSRGPSSAPNSSPSGTAGTDGGTQTPPAADPTAIQVTLTIRCDTAAANWSKLKPDVQDHRIVPADGVILPATSWTMHQGDSVYKLLTTAGKAKGIPVVSKGTDYISSINNLSEFDCGPLSGWMYKVNDKIATVGVGDYPLKAGDAIQFLYTCDLGHDLS